MTVLGAASAAKRQAQAELRRQLRDGELTFAHLVAQRPECVAAWLIPDVLKLIPRVGRDHRSRKNLEVLGAQAAQDGVNLLVPFGLAPDETLVWVAERLGRKLVVPPDEDHLSRLRRLAAAVEQHKRAISNNATPTDVWVLADSVLWREWRQIMGAR